MIRVICYPIVILLFISCNIHAASLDGKTQRFIEALEANEMFHEAITEYKRLLLFNQLTSEEKGIIWMKQAIAYRALNQEASMMTSFTRASRFLENSELINRLYEEIAVFFLSRGKSDWARKILDRADPKFAEIQIRYLILSYLIDHNWNRFFELLENGGYSSQTIGNIRHIVKEIKRNIRWFKLLNIIDKVIPGLGYLFYDDVMITGETLLFHGFFFSQILSETTIPGKIIFGFGLGRMYIKTIAREHTLLRKKLKERKLELEKRIFKKLFKTGQY